MATRKANVVSIKDLSKSVDKAVEVAAKRLQLGAVGPTTSFNWEIIGRKVKGFQDLDVAHDLAVSVAQKVKLSGIVAEPVSIRIGKDILVGFIEKARLPRILGQ